MMIIENKEFDKIVQFFDYTHNEKSRLYVYQILQYKPSSILEIKFRQDSFQYYANKLMNSFPNSYYRSELMVIHHFTINIIRPISHKEFLWKFLFDKRDYNDTISKLRTMILFFNKIYELLIPFSETDMIHIYSNEVRQMISFLDNMEIPKWYKKTTTINLQLKDFATIYNQLYALSSQNSIHIFWEQYFHFEALLSIAFSIKKNNFQFPILTDTNSKAYLKDVYYPFLKNELVLNDLHIHKNVVVLTGPNMSGKSTLLKAIGIAVYLANIGLGAPLKKESIIPYYDDIFVFINHIDDADNGLSHFMKELEKCKTVFQRVKSRRACFAIFDEIFQGSNSAESINLTKYTLQNLVKFNNCNFIFSTHLYEIFNGDFVKTNLIQTIYLDCAIIENKPHFSFKVKEGISTLKIGEWLFHSEGLYDLLK